MENVEIPFEPRQYIIFPPYTTMTPGKMAAQAAHAANKMRKEILEDIDPEDSIRADLYLWENGWGAGTTIVLQGDWAQIKYLESELRFGTPRGVHFGIWHDPSYPFVCDYKHVCIDIDVCAYLFGDKTVLQPYLEGFKLHP